MFTKKIITVFTVISILISVSTNSNSNEPMCSPDMIEIEGNFCPNVEQKCLHWLDISDKEMREGKIGTRCQTFAPTKCLSEKKFHKHFCIDRYEFPNKKGTIPEVMISWNDMKNNCAKENKRLCYDTEWTFACEGEEILPYPYGYTRDSTACNIDNSVPDGKGPNFNIFLIGTKAEIAEEVKRLDMRKPSGSMPKCISPFGVESLTGNVDESVINSSGIPHKSAEMGGHWFKGARNRCRPKTTGHDETFYFYEIGGRCCKDINNEKH